jgi:hypothetical protein
MKQQRFSLALLVAVALGLVSACGDSKDVCGAQKNAAASCSFVAAPLDACESNLSACGDGEREKWVEHFDCLQSHCDAGEPQIVVQQVCAIELGGVSYDCTPGGSNL